MKDALTVATTEEGSEPSDNQKPRNIIKVRDDHEPICFISATLQENSELSFVLTKGYSANWFSGDSFSITDLRGRVEPWLTSLFQSEHLSLLIGSGLTTAIQISATKKVANNGMNKPEIKTKYNDVIESAVKKSVVKSGRGEANVEDYIRVMNDLLRGLEILSSKEEYNEPKNELLNIKEDYSILKSELDEIISQFVLNISLIENQIATAPVLERTDAFNKLLMFLMSFSSRTGTRDRLNIFTTNYDRLIEAGAELAGLHLLERFIGTLAPIFRSSRLDLDMHYNPPGIRGEPRYLEGVARYTKLHGSIDWVNAQNEIRKIRFPFGATDIKPYLSSPGLEESQVSQIMIYPNASKDRETAEYPYVELFRDFAAALCRPNSTLVTYGYSFGDDHINRIIRDMLTIPSTHVVIISYEDNTGRIMKKYEEIGRPSQMSLLIGPDLAEIGVLTKYFLPRPSIDRNTIRMAELLKQRYSEQPSKQEHEDKVDSVKEMHE